MLHQVRIPYKPFRRGSKSPNDPLASRRLHGIFGRVEEGHARVVRRLCMSLHYYLSSSSTLIVSSRPFRGKNTSRGISASPSWSPWLRIEPQFPCTLSSTSPFVYCAPRRPFEIDIQERAHSFIFQRKVQTSLSSKSKAEPERLIGCGISGEHYHANLLHLALTMPR